MSGKRKPRPQQLYLRMPYFETPAPPPAPVKLLGGATVTAPKAKK